MVCSAVLPPPIPGRRVGRRVSTTALVKARVPSWPGFTFDLLVCYGRTYGWDLPREFTLHGIDGRLDVVHEWSRK